MSCSSFSRPLYLSFSNIEGSSYARCNKTSWTFLCFIVRRICRMFLSPLTLVTLCHFSHNLSNYLLHPSPAFHFKPFGVFLISFFFESIQVSAPYKAVFQIEHFISVFLIFKSSLLVERFSFLLNVTFAMEILALISYLHLATIVRLLK